MTRVLGEQRVLKVTGCDMLHVIIGVITKYRLLCRMLSALNRGPSLNIYSTRIYILFNSH